MKSTVICAAEILLLFSLSRGSGLKFYGATSRNGKGPVLPLTREWIEITKSADKNGLSSFSLSRGSGLKWVGVQPLGISGKFSLSRGSGLKSTRALPFKAVQRSPSHEGVD